MGEAIVIGAGIAGLAAAHRWIEAGERSVLVLESAERVGGNIRTTREDGFTIEWGVNGFLDNIPETLDLARALGLEVVRAGASASLRYLYRDGRLRPVPMKPQRFLGSDLLSVGGRLRVLGEPFARARAGGDETIFDFASRRIGREAAEILVSAMVAGVYAGDARKLSLASTFPKMAQMEQDHGSLTRAMLAKARARRRNGAAKGAGRSAGASAGGPAGPAGTLSSFQEGMETLVATLADRIGRERIRTRTPVRAVERAGAGYRVRLDDGERLPAEKVIVAAPARAAASFLRPLDAELAGELEEIEYAPLAVVALAYRVEDLPSPLAGFGFLAPPGQGLRILGCLWDSSIFTNRAPKGWALLRAMIGGARDPEAAGLPEEQLLQTVGRDLAASMGLRGAPRWHRVFRHPLGIPQYVVGHAARLSRIEERRSNWPGLTLSGNSYRGVSVNHCVAEAARFGPG
jgi:oxygen-dependent protoporphyrinogen oxidase